MQETCGHPQEMRNRGEKEKKKKKEEEAESAFERMASYANSSLCVSALSSIRTGCIFISVFVSFA